MDDSFHYTAPDIDSYLAAAKAYVAASRTDLDGERADWIIDGNSPFLLPAQAGAPSRGALLMAHGLADSPFALRDMAGFFQRQGYHVLGMQLPGHGSRPGDLLQVRWHDWARAHQHLFDLLEKAYGPVSLFGFSAGAALSVLQALRNPQVRALYVFSPAIGITGLARLAFVFRHMGRVWRRFAWFDVQPDTDCFKYESLSNQAIAETWSMIQAMHRLQALERRRIPLFVAASERDATLKSAATLAWFAGQIAPRAMLYYTTGAPAVPEFVTCIPAHLPEQRIRSFAHTSIIQAPDNPHYGAHGSARFCTHYYHFDPDKYRRCRAGEEDCLGEMFDESAECQVVRRLTYNPLFASMLESLTAFIQRTRL